MKVCCNTSQVIKFVETGIIKKVLQVKTLAHSQCHNHLNWPIMVVLAQKQSQKSPQLADNNLTTRKPVSLEVKKGDLL